MYRHLAAALALPTLFAVGNVATAQWMPTAFPEGRKGIQFLSLAARGDTLYAGAYRGGLFRSTDDGLRWEAADAGLPRTDEGLLDDVLSVLAQDDAVYAGTYAGVYRSTDGGEGWTPAHDGLPDPAIAQALLHEGGVLLAGTRAGVYRSTDGGEGWTLGDGLPLDLSGNVLPVEALALHQGLLFAGTYDGVYRSADGGATWEAANTGIPPDRGTFHPRVRAFARVGADLFAATISGGGVYRSSDHGEHWRALNDGLPQRPNGQTASVIALAALDGILVAGTDRGLYRSADLGQTWTPSRPGLPEDLYVPTLTARGASLFAATFQGLYRSDDQGRSWRLVVQSVPTPARVRALGSSDPHLFATAEQDDLYQTRTPAFRSTDAGASWLPADAALTGSTFFANVGADLYAGGGCLYRSADHGLHWTLLGEGQLPCYVRAVAAHGGRLYAGTGRYILNADDGAVYLSEDEGTTWAQGGLADVQVLTLVALEGGVLAGTGGLYAREGVLWTTDGVLWEPVNEGLPERVGVFSLVVAGADVFAVTDAGVFVSSTGRIAWTPFNTGFPAGLAVRALLAVGDLLLAGADRGVYVSPRRLARWTALHEGLPDDGARRVRALALFEDDVFIGTEAGLWRRPLAEVLALGSSVAAEQPAAFHLDPVHPNPFRGRTTIPVVLAGAAQVSLKIYDVQGRQIATLFSGWMAGGTHRFVWDASRAPAGLYLCRLTTATAAQTRTLVVVR